MDSANHNSKNKSVGFLMGKVMWEAILIYRNMEDRIVPCYLGKILTEPQSQVFRLNRGMGRHVAPSDDPRHWNASS